MIADLKALARRMYDDVISNGRLDLLDDFIHDDFVEHETMPGMPTDKEAPRAFVGMLRAGFPDVTATIEEMVREGDTVAVRARLRGIHSGDFMGIPPTGRAVDVPVFDMLRFSEGKCIEHWGTMDAMALMQQLGVMPESPAV